MASSGSAGDRALMVSALQRGSISAPPCTGRATRMGAYSFNRPHLDAAGVAGRSMREHSEVIVSGKQQRWRGKQESCGKKLEAATNNSSRST